MSPSFSIQGLKLRNLGDLLAIKHAGAYGAVMSSQYNSRDLIPEIMIANKNINIIRKRITIEDFLSYESIPE